MEQSILNEEEEIMKKIMEQSEKEEKERQAMIKKNEELVNMMKKIEDDKPENWGLKKIEADTTSEQSNVMEAYAINMNKAIKKLELKDKISNIKNKG
jgi:DNA-binding PucR family transcriptional regulator